MMHSTGATADPKPVWEIGLSTIFALLALTVCAGAITDKALFFSGGILGEFMRKPQPRTCGLPGKLSWPLCGCGVVEARPGIHFCSFCSAPPDQVRPPIS